MFALKCNEFDDREMTIASGKHYKCNKNDEQRRIGEDKSKLLTDADGPMTNDTAVRDSNWKTGLCYKQSDAQCFNAARQH